MIKSQQSLRQKRAYNIIFISNLQVSLILILFLVSCNEVGKDCVHKSLGIDKKIMKTIGCLSDSLETGYWEKFNEMGKTVEKGYYSNGLKAEEWLYSFDNREDVSLFWEKFQDDKNQLQTNIPSIISKTEKFDFYTKFNSSDTSKFLTLTIGIYSPTIKNIDIDTFYKEIERDILSEGYQYESVKMKFQCDGRVFYFVNTTALHNENNIGLINILNFYGFDVNKNFIEITCIGKNTSSNCANIILADVSSNLFIGKNRFIHPLKNMGPLEKY
jgi:hypothetical protein